jgi:uncharacterized alpha/beta hydrolase family protein
LLTDSSQSRGCMSMLRSSCHLEWVNHLGTSTGGHCQNMKAHSTTSTGSHQSERTKS